ncbi:hypothetical protein [Deinococcus sp. QL22]|nr:hypothetical protein [Deinococcus sp. QL22]UQN10731.1 hypothetical protein M1R55_31345 [Deinococcus sp. QL22]UQN10776.1 hypothetical protein M1R55_31090 [Deinococcus sp. QL22]
MQKSLQLEGGIFLSSGTFRYTPVTDVTSVQATITNSNQAEHWRGEYEV